MKHLLVLWMFLVVLLKVGEACSNLFIYNLDRRSGTFELLLNTEVRITTTIEIAVGSAPFNKDAGELRLSEAANVAQRRLQKAGSIRYTFVFPPTSNLVKVVKISQNDRDLCFNGTGSEDDWGSVVKYRHIFHTFARPLPNASDVNPQEEYTTPYMELVNIPTPRWSLPRNKLSDICGLTNSNASPSGRFNIQEWPWIVSIRHVYKPEFHCTGTLITFRTIATSAHCFRQPDREENPQNLIVLLGTTNVNLTLSAGVRQAPVSDIFYYPEYKPDTLENDFALVILLYSVRLSGSIRPACTWSPEKDLQPPTKGFIGSYFSVDGALANAIVLEVRVTAREECKNRNLSLDKLCIENSNSSHVCNEDSGTGLLSQRDGRWVLRGILSAENFRRTSCTWNHTTYLDLNNFLKWTRQVLIEQFSYDIAN